MTQFIKENFTWDGMYLNYDGDQGIYNKTYGETFVECHSSRKDLIVPLFIARFKHGSKPWKTWVNFIVKNFTVEEWVELMRTETNKYPGGMSPVAIIQSKGFMEPSEKKLCKKYGLAPTLENYAQALKMSWS